MLALRRGRMLQAERRHVALSHMDRRMTALFYNFNVFNTFLGSVLGGALFSQAGTLVNEPGERGQKKGGKEGRGPRRRMLRSRAAGAG